MADDKLKILEERLTRLEAALSRAGGTGGGTVPGGVVSDPAPYPWPHWGYRRWPHPVVDPGPFPHPVVDPGPFPHAIVDPATMGPQVATTAMALGRIGHVGDPPPIDFSRFSISQLESALHSINAEKARLDSLEKLINTHLERAKQG